MVRPELRGILSQSGRRYVEIRLNEKIAYLSLEELCTDDKTAKIKLGRSGIYFIAPREWNMLKSRIQEMTLFEPQTVAERVGWNERAFALPNGIVLSTSDQQVPFAMAPAAHRFSRRGSHSGWKTKVAGPLAGQQLASFILMATFMPPLLKLSSRVGNVGFEIVGAKGTGKSTVLYLASSALGGVLPDGNGHYWISLDTTFNGLEEHLALSSDMPMLLDEANLIAPDATAKERAQTFKGIAFKLFDGTFKTRWGASQEDACRFAYVITSNEPLETLVGSASENARAAADRLLTIPIDANRMYGAFDILPKGFTNSSDLANRLMKAADKHHGHAFEKFVRCLVDTRVRDEAGLRSTIDNYIERFRQAAKIDRNNGSQVRVADAFGLVYAAGKFAKKFGVLPAQFEPKQAALACYRRHLAHRQVASPLTLKERLAQLCLDPRVVTVSEGADLPEDALGYIVTIKQRRELLIVPEMIESVFPDWDRLKKSREVEKTLRRDGKHTTVKRKILGTKQRRYHAFKLPPV